MPSKHQIQKNRVIQPYNLTFTSITQGVSFLAMRFLSKFNFYLPLWAGVTGHILEAVSFCKVPKVTFPTL